MVTQGLKVPTLAIFSVLILSVCYDGIRLVHDKRFNHALAIGHIARISGSDDPHRQFAIAYDLQQQRDFKAAVNAYAAINAPSGSELQISIKYNLANLYFREATRLRAAGADDLAMPLVELAKQNHKEILRIDNGHWDAKYNLELALFVAPETDPADTLEERNPERSPRALTTIKSREPLP